ncbi:HdeD family acid-resistance protein [Nocardioides conyzicola]|uniref:HdeD family acid-resistance protein n=1 Tax=Nocardioides conyzicola TaxID=1651781 RepID=A0ABP8XFF7_9ACTN
MSDATDTVTGHRTRPASPGLAELAEHWGVVLAYGLVTLGLGIALAVWPDASVTVFTVLLAIQLVVAGIFRISAALSHSRSEGGVRALLGLSGGLALIVGLLILRDPLQSVLVLGMILGVFWVLAGVIDIIGAFIAPPPSGRGWELLAGVVSVLAGGFLLEYTDLSLRLLVVFVGIWLVVAGVLALVAALRLRSLRPTA